MRTSLPHSNTIPKPSNGFGALKYGKLYGSMNLKMKKSCPNYWGMINLIVDDYFPMLREMAKYTNELEEKIINQQINNPIEEILLLKKDLTQS